MSLTHHNHLIYLIFHFQMKHYGKISFHILTEIIQTVNILRENQSSKERGCADPSKMKRYSCCSAAQIGLLNGRACQQLSTGAGGNDFTGFQHIATVSHA